MKISRNMDITQLIESMGDATEADAQIMRELLADWAELNGVEDTSDVPESAWDGLLQMVGRLA